MKKVVSCPLHTATKTEYEAEQSHPYLLASKHADRCMIAHILLLTQKTEDAYKHWIMGGRHLEIRLH